MEIAEVGLNIGLRGADSQKSRNERGSQGVKE
jgi:hypothetical protein